MSTPSKDDFERTFQIAEYARQSGENRRQYEFKIFISYVTLLILTIHESHHIEDLNKCFVLGLLLVVYIFYIAWTISLSVANQNDGARRNFYLQRAEYISDSFLEKFGHPLSQKLPSDYPKLGESHEQITKVPRFYEFWKYKNQLWINYAATFQVVLPTILFFLLISSLIRSE